MKTTFIILTIILLASIAYKNYCRGRLHGFKTGKKYFGLFCIFFIVSCSQPVHIINYDSGMEKTKTIILNDVEVIKLNKTLKEGYKIETIGYNQFEVTLTKQQIEKTKGKWIFERSALPKSINNKLRTKN